MDYAFHKVDDFMEKMRPSANPLREAFRAHMVLVSKALRSIEWVDSADYGAGDEDDDIRAVLRPVVMPVHPLTTGDLDKLEQVIRGLRCGNVQVLEVEECGRCGGTGREDQA